MVTDRLGAVLAAISDPTRRAIINRLARGPARVTDVAAPFPVSFNTVSKHVKALERVRLVRRTRRGREHTLTLNAEPLRMVIRWVSRYERFWNERLDQLEAFFEARKEELR
jgi:DNA-binding transcriptional ArsR family regulator